jgi:hypothetical protein
MAVGLPNSAATRVSVKPDGSVAPESSGIVGGQRRMAKGRWSHAGMRWREKAEENDGFITSSNRRMRAFMRCKLKMCPVLGIRNGVFA